MVIRWIILGAVICFLICCLIGRFISGKDIPPPEPDSQRDVANEENETLDREVEDVQDLVS